MTIFIFPTNSCFLLDPPTSGGGFHKARLDMTFVAFYQPMVILTTCYGHPPMSVMSAHTHPF
jgi:hypothetical protein